MGQITRLEQLGQECNKVCPFVHILKRCETLVHLLGILLELWVGIQGGRCVGYSGCIFGIR